jgi:hypothetical protein
MRSTVSMSGSGFWGVGGALRLLECSAGAACRSRRPPHLPQLHARCVADDPESGEALTHSMLLVPRASPLRLYAGSPSLELTRQNSVPVRGCSRGTSRHSFSTSTACGILSCRTCPPSRPGFFRSHRTVRKRQARPRLNRPAMNQIAYRAARLAAPRPSASQGVWTDKFCSHPRSIATHSGFLDKRRIPDNAAATRILFFSLT